MKGIVTRLHRDKGFGFIRGEDGVSRFFHAKHVIPEMDFDLLQEQSNVLFEPVNPADPFNIKGNGLRARCVERDFR